MEKSFKTNEVLDSQFEDLRIYEITEAKQITEFLGETIILNRYKDNFQYLYDRVVDVASLCWNNIDTKFKNKLQHTQVIFKIDVHDSVEYCLPLNRFMTSLAFIKPIIQFIDDVNLNDFLVHSAMSQKDREKLQKNVDGVLKSQGKTIQEIHSAFADLALDLQKFTIIFAHADMCIFTAENIFLDHYRESDVIKRINNTEYPSDMQTVDIIESNKELYSELEAEMIRRKNPLFMANLATRVTKDKQMEELYINFSQIPDGKNIVPVIMNGNGFKAGYNDLDVLYAGSIAARVPDIMNEKYMGPAGYFNRNLMISTYGSLSKTVWDCGSQNPIKMVMTDKQFRMMDGRMYYTKPEGGVLKIFNAKDDKHLMGETLYFRSPCTCNLNEDICHVCYGTMALKVGTLVGGFIYTTELMTSRVSQNILSAKHLLKTDAEPITFSEGWEKWFTIDSSSLIPNEGKRFDIFIKEDYQDNISETLTLYIGIGKGQMFPVTIGNYSNIYIPDKVIDQMKDIMIDDELYHKITSHKVLEQQMGICNITPINNMMNAKFLDIMKLFESEISRFESVEEVVDRLMELLDGNIPIYSVHGELIISKHLRRIDNKLLRPNWCNPGEQYQILRLKTALQNIESVTTALSFEQTRYHLLQTIFDDRNLINRVGPRSFADFSFGYENL